MDDEHNDVLLESNNANVADSVNVVEGLTFGGGVVNVLEVGMLFKDKNDMYEF